MYKNPTCVWFNGDKESRSEWEETYTKGLDQLGLKFEDRTEPWAGACGVFHPMMSEAVIRFQSQAISEMFPAQGPVRTKIVGKITEDKEKQAELDKKTASARMTTAHTTEVADPKDALKHLQDLFWTYCMRHQYA